jgi:methyl-accepting chemotaxis protein
MRKSLILQWLVVAAAALTVVAATDLSAPDALYAQAPATEETPAPQGSAGIDTGTEVEIQRRFNDLRRELLDDRAAAINWWLSGIALLLTILAIVIAAAGYLGIRKFQDILADVHANVDKARMHAEEARKLVEEIRQYGEEAGEFLRGMGSVSSGSAQVVTDEDYMRDAARVGASAIAEARQLAEDGMIGEAIERWRQIANVAARTNDDLAALAHRSIGDLSEQRSRGHRP